MTLLLVVLGVLVAPIAARGATVQVPTTAAPGVTVAPGLPPTSGVLVPGDTIASTVPEAPGTNPTQLEVPAADDSGDPDAGRTVWMAIIGLGIVAFLILVLTIIYARHTRPGRWAPDAGDWALPEVHDELLAPTAARSVFAHQEDEQGFWWAED